jgi:hypothetical protein
MVILENVTRSPLTLLLELHSEETSFIRRVNVVVEKHDRETGAMSTAVERRRVPSSLTLWPKGMDGSSSAPLPRAVLQCAEVRAALSANPPRLRVRHVAVEVAPPAAAPAPTAVPAESTSEPTPAADGAPDAETTTDQAAPRRGRKGA